MESVAFADMMLTLGGAMFYDTRSGDHGLQQDPFKACVIPRPIGWISTLAPDGTTNLAPYSFFNAVAGSPPMVMFCSGGRKPDGSAKDTVTNIEATGEFVVNLATWGLKEAMSRSSASVPASVDEFEIAGLETAPSELVGPPRVAASPVHLECRHHQTVDLPTDDPARRNAMVIGRVIGIHIDDAVISDGRVEASRLQPIARLGYQEYARIDAIFSMDRPNAG